MTGTRTRTVGVHEAKTRLSELLRAVEDGEEVVITRGGKAVARLSAPSPVRYAGDFLGAYKGQIHLGAPFSDADDEIAQMFGRSEIHGIETDR